MPGKPNNRPSDFVLIERTRRFFITSLKGTVTDTQLLNAWKRFHRLYDPIIRRFAGSCGIEGEALEDVVQTAWSIVIEDLPRFECDPSKGRFRAWLFLRVRSASVRQVRESTRRREQCAGIDFDNHYSRELEPTRTFEMRWNSVVLDEAFDILEQCVSRLDFKLFVMYRLYGSSIAELADDSGIGVNTVRSKLSRTMKTLEKICENRGYGELMFPVE